MVVPQTYRGITIFKHWKQEKTAQKTKEKREWERTIKPRDLMKPIA